MGGAREVAVREVGLRGWLAAGRVPAARRVAFEHAMRAPWCWPGDPAVAVAVRAQGIEPPAAPAPGEVLLVSVAAHEDRAALWRLGWMRAGAGEEVPFAGDAHGSLVRACAIAPRVAPHLHSLGVLGRPPRGAAPVFKRGPGADRTLAGESFGLPLLLAAVSALTDRPAPTRFAATAALRDDGSLEPVAGLPAKLALLADAALAVDTVLVADAQRDEAERIVRSLDRRLAVISLRRAAEAVATVFPDALGDPPALWSEPARARAVTDALFALCRDGAAVPRWSAVERAAGWLVERLEPATRWGLRARFAARVAARHALGAEVAMRWEDFVTPDIDQPRQIAAHVVQAAADAGIDELPAYLDRARSLLAVEVVEPSALTLLGAVGRGLAALRRYDEAAVALAQATRAWLESSTPTEASYPLSEWLRVAALARGEGAWARAVDAVAAYPHDAPRDLGGLFVRAALARGHGLRGDSRAALAALAGPAWRDAPPWLWRSTRRTRAQALEELGQREEAEALRRALDDDPDERAQVEAAFARLDATLARGDDPTAALDAVLATRPQGLRWLLEGAADAGERARRVAREYPY